MSTYVVTAIDTDAGKTVVTGLLGKYLKQAGQDVITMKLSQTGCENLSDDIAVHRQIMGMDLLPEDKDGLTCPYLFKFPASPHLAAAMENVYISENRLISAIQRIEGKYANVLVEGVGGLMVPINEDLLLVDFIQKHTFPVIVVTSGRLGSINHTLLTLEVLKGRNIPVYGLIYNHYPVTEVQITADSARLLRRYLLAYYPDAKWGEVPMILDNSAEELQLDLPGWFE